MTAPPEAAASAPPAKKASRAGRNLPAAIAVGAGLGGALLVTIYVYRPAYVVLVGAAIGLGVHELVSALEKSGARLPMIPLVAGGVTTAVIGYPYGSDAAVAAALVTVLVSVAWRVLLPPRGATPGSTGRDAAACALVTLYVGFLAAFAILLITPSDGPRRVTAMMVTAVCSDIGGYAAGVLSGGKHKLAPSISPGKSVEGLLGGILVCVVSGVIFLVPVLHSHWYYGVAFGLAIVATAVVGDLAESSLKRDLGVKDMGNLLPGHGGVLDRIDSLLLSAPVGWLLLNAMVPIHH